MAKKTLLQITQNILSSLDADEVNSINDTIEAMQVAEVIGTVYDDMADGSNWPHLHKLSTLDNVGDITKPTHMKMAEGVKELTSIKYNTRKATDDRDKYQRIREVDNELFLNMVNSRNSSKDNVITVVDFDGASMLMLDDTAPTMWTSFDDEHIVFDSYDKEVDSTLQGSKTQLLAFFDPTPFSLSDSFIPDLPSEAFTALQAEAKSTAFLEVNQITNDKAEQVSRRSQTWLSKKAFKTGGGIKYNVNYGRTRSRQRDTFLDLSSTSTRSAK